MNHHNSLNKFKSSVVDKDNQKWEVYWQSLKHTIPGSEEQKQSTLRKRVLKFFKDFKVDEQTCYNQRRDIKMQNNVPLKVCPDVLMLYGIDYLQNQRIIEKFSPYECQVERIDYSHCIVTFLGENQISLYALYSRLINKPANLQTLIQLFTENNTQLITWREIQGYKQICFDKKLWARFILESELEQLRRNNFQSKDLETYQLIKSEFMQKMNKIYMKKNLNNNFPKKHKQRQCNCCKLKMNKIKQMLNCCHKNKNSFNRDKHRRQQSTSRERSRSRDQEKKIKGYKFKGFNDVLADVQPLTIVKQITTPFNYYLQKQKKNKQSNKQSIPQKMNQTSSFISKIGKLNKQQDDDQDQLYRDMLLQMQKYDPFADGTEIANTTMNSKMNSSKYSAYERWSEDDEA